MKTKAEANLKGARLKECKETKEIINVKA